MNNLRLSLVSLFVAVLLISCGAPYAGTYQAKESEYLEVLERSRDVGGAEVVMSALKSEVGDDWNTVKIKKDWVVINGSKQSIKVVGKDLYVDISDTLKELEKYIGSVASDIERNQKWGTFSSDYSSITTTAGYKYYKVK